MKHSTAARRTQLLGVCRWAGISIDDDQYVRLETFAEWLVDEAIPSGGLGPAEAPRIWGRHVVESLVFSGAVPAAGAVIDVGSGVGLPTIPLAIAYPDVEFVPLDRSQRRIDLLERAQSILGLTNVGPVLADADLVTGAYEGLTSRAAAGVELTLHRATALLRPDGVGLMGLSRTNRDLKVAQHPELHVDLMTVPTELLDAPLTLLRMVRRVDRKH